MGNISKQPITITKTLLLIVTITTLITTNNSHQLHIFSHSLPLPLSTPPPSHAPSPSHHHHHHSHHHVYAPSPQPSQHLTPSPQPAASAPLPAKPVTPSHPAVGAKAPAKPVVPPVKGPVAGPRPVGVKRKFVAVQGMVYCKSNCTFAGVNTLFGASPLPGARVILRCKNTKYILRKTATTDKNGYFFLQAPQFLTTYGAHKCKVYLAHHRPNTTSTGPLGPCSSSNSSPTDLNNGSTGAYLFSNNTGPPSPLPTFSLFSVGPFAYESSKCH